MIDISFNSLQTGKHTESADHSDMIKNLLSFNSLQTGKHTERTAYKAGAKMFNVSVSIPFKRESTLKVESLTLSQQRLKTVSIPFKRESTLKGERLHSLGVSETEAFQFPSNGKAH